ncbi:MAG: hypothetical protein KF725_08140 [Cyclobacteriaceae bacterium]|nr:hypothetical protein [Cyclobacteriaceae bacterium]UYN87923.1 MAG: hypothetical protein KIT51_06635 [Cyclobacteriaceae bacterium]
MKRLKILLRISIPLIVAYLLLMIPDGESPSFLVAESEPFVWNMDGHWKSLEAEFTSLKTRYRSFVDSLEYTRRTSVNILFTQLEKDDSIKFNDNRLKQLLIEFFEWSAVVAASGQSKEYLEQYTTIRHFIKRQSRYWNVNDPAQRATLYSLLYGMRAAIEEVLLQADTVNFNPVQYVTIEPSVTPSATLQGITVHSGDLFVSRGGAEVSAFISRGNDYPGNFSHVALLHVDETGKASFIEAHIEKGVAIATAEEYLGDKKLRFMVLRPRADLPQLINNPMLPHHVAKTALDETNRRHIPYDFKMDFYDSSAMFCSEVGSFAYQKHGLKLWRAESTISSPGTAKWLNTFGVENFVTQMPSDLEYDPQLSIVAEWSDPETLMKDHIDNAVMDALLERANAGMDISYNPFLLPLARIVKGYSILQNKLGKPGIIPEGMNATRALKNNSFVDIYQKVKIPTEQKIAAFIEKNGYRPPYWQKVEFAQESFPH